MNDEDLRGIVRSVELPYAEDEGAPKIAGAYIGLTAWSLKGKLVDHFLGGPDSHMSCGPSEKTVLLGCECGEPGCWPLMARVELSEGEVVWRDRPIPSSWSLESRPAGSLRFDRTQYERELQAAARSAPDGG